MKTAFDCYAKAWFSVLLRDWNTNRIEITMICLIVLEENNEAGYFLNFFYKIRLYENSEWIELIWTIGVWEKRKRGARIDPGVIRGHLKST